MLLGAGNHTLRLYQIDSIFSRERPIWQDESRGDDSWQYGQVSVSGVTQHQVKTDTGCLPLTKMFRKFRLGIFHLGRMCSIWSLSFLKERAISVKPQKFWHGRKSRKACNWCKRCKMVNRVFGTSQSRKRDYLFRSSAPSGSFPLERSKTSCSVYFLTRSFGLFL